MRPFTPRLLLLLLPGLLAGVSARAEGIRIQGPEHVLLGSEVQAELRLELAPEATGVALLASRGEVGPLEQVAPGVFRATYVPPKQNLPQVVILAASAQGPQGPLEGWTTLPLWGQGEAEVFTRPGAPVKLRVGKQEFGPIQADRTGVARIPVSVPPGVGEAFFGKKRIELGVPPLPFVHAIVERRQLRADREEVVAVRLYTVVPEGGPRRPGAFSISVERGTIEGPTEVRPGVSVLRWTVPPGPVGTLRLKGTVRAERRWSFRTEVEAVAGPARRFELKVARDEVVASEAARVAVEVSAWDERGNPARAELRLESSLGGAVALTEQAPGRYAGELGVVPGFGGREALELRLLADGGSTPVLTRAVALRAAAPARVTVAPVRPFLIADGHEEATWHISVEDRFGNPVREPSPEYPTGVPEGTLLARGPGLYELRYVQPESRVDGRAEVEVRVGEVSGRGTLPVLRRRPVLMATPRMGLVTNFADVAAPSAGVRLELWPGLVLPDLGLMLDTGYLGFTRTGGAVVPGFSGRNGLLEAFAGLSLRTPPGGRFQAWGAAGPSVAWVHSRARLGEGPVLEEGAWVPGAQALVGAGLSLGPGQPFVEARFFWFADPSLHVLRGTLRGGGLHLGYRLALY